MRSFLRYWDPQSSKYHWRVLHKLLQKIQKRLHLGAETRRRRALGPAIFLVAVCVHTGVLPKKMMALGHSLSHCPF